MATASNAVRACAAIVAARGVARGDAALLPRLLLDEKGSIEWTIRAVIGAFFIKFYHDRVIVTTLRNTGYQRIPSTLGAMLTIFGFLRIVRRTMGKDMADKIFQTINPGVTLLGKWMGVCLAPPLAGLDKSIMALPRYGGDVWVKLVSLVFSGWGATCAFAGTVATKTAMPKKPEQKKGAAAGAAPAANGVLDQGEVNLRSWMLLTSLGLLGHAAAPPNLKAPLARFCQFGTTITSLVLADRRLPPVLKKSFHPLVVCATSANLVTRYVGVEAFPYLDNGKGVGDIFFQWLNVCVSALGFRMYDTTDKWYDDAGNLRCVMVSAGCSAAAAALGTVLASSHPISPLKIPAPLSLPMTNRSVMSALGIEGSMAIGPECDPKLSVASILITGCIGASIGRTLLEALTPFLCDASNPLVRGVAMGCSAHSIGTAGLISEGDTEAAAISGATMCVSGTAHTIFLNLPGMVPYIRSLAL